MRGKERLKMGGKEEKRGACRGESLIICLPISLPLNHKTTQRSVGIRKRGSVGMEQMRSGEVEWVMRLRR